MNYELIITFKPLQLVIRNLSLIRVIYVIHLNQRYVFPI